MAIRLITGRLQQWSNVCKNKFTKEDSMRYTKLQKRGRRVSIPVSGLSVSQSASPLV